MNTDRRVVLKGAAWGVPAMTLAAAAPSVAASSTAVQLSYTLTLVTNTNDPNNPGTSYCTAPQLTVTDTSPSGAAITILKVAGWNDSMEAYTFGPATVGAPLALDQSLTLGGNGAGTLDPGQNFYTVIKWQDAAGNLYTTVTCSITSQHGACGQAGMTSVGTSDTGCSLPAGVSLPAGW